MSPEQVIWLAVAFVAVVNIAVCTWVARSGYFSRGQVIAQAVLVWLVPVLGAILVGMVTWSERHPRRHRDSSEPMEAAGLGDGSLDGGGHAL